MPRSVLPVALVLAAAVADGSPLHPAAPYLLVAAVPAAAVAALTVFGELVQLSGGASVAAARAQALLGAVGLAAVVVAAAARTNAVGGEGLPPLAASAVAACLAAFALQGLVALLAPPPAERA